MNTIISEILKFSPETGFNLVAIDEYALPGEQLTLVGHCDTREDAERELAVLRRQRPSGSFEIYGPIDPSLVPAE